MTCSDFALHHRSLNFFYQTCYMALSTFIHGDVAMRHCILPPNCVHCAVITMIMK